MFHWLRTLVVSCCIGGSLVVSALAGGPSSLIDVRHSDQEFLEELQEMLFELNYLPVVDGVYGEKTERAIRFWQHHVGHIATGRLTINELQMLRAGRSEAPSVWGAASVSSDGKWGAAYNKRSRALAMVIAKRRCERYSAYPQHCSDASTGFNNSWIGVVYCRHDQMQTAALVAGFVEPPRISDIDFANLQAPFNAQDCRIIGLVNATYGLSDVPQ